MSTFGDLLGAGQFVAGSVCGDCHYGVEYGDWPSDSHWTAERDEKSRSTLSTYQVTQGHLHDGPYSHCSHAGIPCDDDCNCERDPMSSSTCSVCGTSQAGERYDVTLVKHADLTP
jgi:hypothetical protein